MTEDLRRPLDRYDLDQLLALTKRERIIDGHEERDGALNIHIGDMSASLDEDRARLYLRGLLRPRSSAAAIFPTPQSHRTDRPHRR
jgi:hypothetical protein